MSAAEPVGLRAVVDPVLAARLRDRITASRADADLQHKRRLLAQMCRLIGAKLGGEASVPAGQPLHAAVAADSVSDGSMSADSVSVAASDVPLSPRVRQTLKWLLQGDSEKQVARRLQVSSHTVHVYVKTLYRKMNVNSRGELLAKFVRAPA